MDKNERNLMGFLEELRKSKKMSREVFCAGIMSKRQYQRYVKGEAEISNANLAKFAEKLGLSILMLYRSFDEFQNNEIQYIRKLYNMLSLLELDKLYVEIKNNPNKVFSNNYYNLLYDFIKIRLLVSLKKISIDKAIIQYTKLANMEELVKGKSFNYVEIAATAELARLEATRGNKFILEQLYIIVTNAKHLSVFTKTESEWLASIYATIATVFGVYDDFNNVITLSNIGIAICKEYQLLVTLSNHYYNLALAYKFLGNNDKGIENIKLCLMAVKLEKSDKKFLNYKNAIEKNFKIKIEELNCFE